MANPTSNLEFLDDPKQFKGLMEGLDAMDDAEKSLLAQKLEKTLTSSSWVSNKLFKPGVRNLHVLERIQARGMYKKLVTFLGDQYYHFKFFFQNKASKGSIPTVMDLLKQAINMPRFRFRLEAMDLLVEFLGVSSLPVMYNLVNGIETPDSGTRLLIENIEQNLAFLTENYSMEPKFKGIFKDIRFKLMELEQMLSKMHL